MDFKPWWPPRQQRRGEGTLLPLEMRPSTIAPNPAESREAPPTPQYPSTLRQSPYTRSALSPPCPFLACLLPKTEGRGEPGVRVAHPALPLRAQRVAGQKPDSVSPASRTQCLFYSKWTWRLGSEVSIKGTGQEEEAAAKTEWPSQWLAGAHPSPCSEGSVDTRLHLG